MPDLHSPRRTSLGDRLWTGRFVGVCVPIPALGEMVLLWEASPFE